MTLNPKLGLNHPELAVCDPWGKDLCLVDFSPTGQEEEDPSFLSLSLFLLLMAEISSFSQLVPAVFPLGGCLVCGALLEKNIYR